MVETPLYVGSECRTVCLGVKLPLKSMQWTIQRENKGYFVFFALRWPLLVFARLNLPRMSLLKLLNLGAQKRLLPFFHKIFSSS